MGLLQPFRGRYVSANSASTMLDVQSILAGCDAVDSEANHISEYAHKIAEFSAPMDQRNFSIAGETVFGMVDEYCTGINSIESQIISTVEQIREMAEAQYNQLQERLNYEAQVRDQEEYNRMNRR